MRRSPFLLLASALVLIGSVARAQQENDSESFMTKFEQASAADSFVQMKELVAKNRPHVTNGFMLFETLYCKAAAEKQDADVKTRLKVLDNLATVMQLEYKDKFLADRLAWVKALTPELCRKKGQLWELLADADRANSQAQVGRTPEAFQQAIDAYNKVLPIAQEVGDAYWLINGNYWVSEGYKGKLEYFAACYYIKKAIEIGREAKFTVLVETYKLVPNLKALSTNAKIRDDLIDVTVPLDQAKAKYEEAEKKAATEGGGLAPGGGTVIPAGVTNAPPLANKHTMKADWVDGEKPKYFTYDKRPFIAPNYRASTQWYFWYGQGIPAGKAEKLHGIPGENQLRNDKGKLLFDPDGAGKQAEDKLKVAEGKPEMITFKAREYPDKSLGDVTLRMMLYPNPSKIMGFDLKDGKGPAERTVSILWQGASAFSTKFNGTDITVYDDSADGNFVAYGEDTVVVGSGKTARVQPLSKYIYIGDLLFEMKLESNGAGVRFKPYDGPIALFKFDYKANTMPIAMVAEGSGEQSGVYFNMMDAKDKPMWIPPGNYHLREGFFAFGEGEKRETIKVEKGKSSEFGVTEGKLNTVAMGAAKDPGFNFLWKSDSRREKGEDFITIAGKTIQIFGCSGEEYKELITGPVKPTVRMKATKDGPDVFTKEMKPPAREDINGSTPAFDVIFFPKTLDVKKPVTGDVFIQLEADYPKLGKITSQPTPAN